VYHNKVQPYDWSSVVTTLSICDNRLTPNSYGKKWSKCLQLTKTDHKQRSVTCHMKSYSVTAATQHRWTCPHITLARQVGTAVGMEGWVDLHKWLIIYRDGLPVQRESPTQVPTRPSIWQQQLGWLDTRCYRVNP